MVLLGVGWQLLLLAPLRRGPRTPVNIIRESLALGRLEITQSALSWLMGMAYI